MANPFENFKSTPFVSQYAGLPLDEFLQSAGTLQKRSQDNMAQIDSLEMMANQIKVLDGVDDGVKAARLADIRSRIESIAATGNAYEHASSMIRSEAKSFAQDQTLQDASKAYGDYAAMSAEAKSNDVSPAQLVKLNNAMSQYKTAGGAAKGAKLGSVSFYKEEDLAKAVADVVKDWKASGTVTSTSADGYIHKRDFESVSATEVQAAAVAYLQGNPKFMRQLSDQATYRTYVDKLNTGFIPEFAYAASYGGGDAEAVQKNLGLIFKDTVKLGVDKTSYTKDLRTMTSDSSYWAALDYAGKNSIFSTTGPAINTRQYPQSYEEYKTTLKDKTTQLGRINADLANKGNSKEVNAQLTAQKAKLTEELGSLGGLLETYVGKKSKSLTAEQRKNLDFSQALEAAGAKIPALEAVRSPGMMSATGFGAPSGYLSKSNRSPKDEMPQAYAIFTKVFGRTPKSSEEIRRALSEGNSIVKDVYFGDDFSDYLKNYSDSKAVAPTIYLATGSDKALVTAMGDVLRVGTFTGYSPSKSGNISPVEMAALQKAGLLVKGITGVTDDNKSMIVAQVPVYDKTKHAGLDDDVVEYLEKYSGQTLYIKEEGGTNNIGPLATSLINRGKAATKYANSQGLSGYGNISAGAVDGVSQTDPTSYVFHEIITSLGKGTEGTVPLVDKVTGVTLGKVSSHVLPGGTTTYSITPAGSKPDGKRYTEAEAVAHAQNMYILANKK